MSLNTSRLEKAKRHNDGRIVARCPACAEAGSDKTGNHLTVWPSGKWSCCVQPGDKAHNKRIFDLLGGTVEPLQRKTIPVMPKVPSVNCTRMMREWLQETPPGALPTLAVALGVSEHSLGALNAAWAERHKAWAFPMRDGYGDIIGIRLRAMGGEKWAVTGSRSGIFIPTIHMEGDLYVTEGPTDTAAAIDLGLHVVGRPSCCCGGDYIRTYARAHKVKRVVMVADNDTPGIEGAKKVAKEIGLPSILWVPPVKDIREFVCQGGTRALIESEIKDLVAIK